MAWAVLDTNIYIDHWEQRLHGDLLARIERTFVVRLSSVVLHELRRGARTPQAQRLVGRLATACPVHWEPTRDDWWDAAILIQRVADKHDWDRSRRRAIQNDALIALTARRHGATVVSANRADFELLARAVSVRLLLA